jgi:hypothetical protein
MEIKSEADAFPMNGANGGGRVARAKEVKSAERRSCHMSLNPCVESLMHNRSGEASEGARVVFSDGDPAILPPSADFSCQATRTINGRNTDHTGSLDEPGVPGSSHSSSAL